MCLAQSEHLTNVGITILCNSHNSSHYILLNSGPQTPLTHKQDPKPAKNEKTLKQKSLGHTGMRWSLFQVFLQLQSPARVQGGHASPPAHGHPWDSCEHTHLAEASRKGGGSVAGHTGWSSREPGLPRGKAGLSPTSAAWGGFQKEHSFLYHWAKTHCLSSH